MVESLDNIQTRLLIFEIWETLIPSKIKPSKVCRKVTGERNAAGSTVDIGPQVQGFEFSRCWFREEIAKRYQ